jgi:cysteinyl-tRNA synthetase
MLEILGLSIPGITDEKKEEVNQMIKKREEARKEKQFEEADKIRDRLNEMNVELIDHKGKTIWMIKEKIKAEK